MHPAKATTHHKKRAKRAASTQLQAEFGFYNTPRGAKLLRILWNNY